MGKDRLDSAGEDMYTPYEVGLKALVQRLGREHPAYSDALVYQQRLGENLAATRAYGDDETRRAARAELLHRLDALAQAALEMPFAELCPGLPPEGLPPQPVVIVSPEDRVIEADYVQTLVERECRFLPLSGRDPRASTTAGLEIHLEKVYIALNTTERPPQASAEGRAEGRDTETFSALRVFCAHHHLILLGEPGSGKSTFANHLALCLAGERWSPGEGWAAHLKAHDAAWEGAPPLPIRVRLREFAADTACLPPDGGTRGRAEHLLAYLKTRLAAGFYGDDFPAHALRCLRRGDALLILDGLDEVGDPTRRAQVAQAIADLAQRRCAQARMLVTCRTRQYPLDTDGCPLAAWAIPGFHTVTLRDFDREQITHFVQAWFAELCALGRFTPAARDHKVQTLTTAVRERADLQDIAPRPIILTQMALVHDFEGELPATRVKLYAACAELLLWKWEQLRAQQAGQQRGPEDFFREVLRIPHLRKEDVERALDHAVYEAHTAQGETGDGVADIPVALVRAQVTGCLERAGLPAHAALAKAQRFVNDYLQHRNGLIVPAGERTFQTPHRTFQEFMAARWLQSRRHFRRDAPGLVRENYDLWREVFLLAVGAAGLVDAVDAVAHMCPKTCPTGPVDARYVILAGQALEEIGLPKVRSDEEGPDIERRVKHFLKHIMQNVLLPPQPPNPPTTQPPTPPTTKFHPERSRRANFPIPTRYAAGEVLDRLQWLPEDLDSFVEIVYPNHASRINAQPPATLNEINYASRITHHVSFLIAKYPLTNHQFARFMEAGGYENPAYWGGEESEAWAWRTGEPRYDWQRTDRPDYWDDPRLGKSRHGYPVVGITWYEARAYCTWRTERLRGECDKLQVWRENEAVTWKEGFATWEVRLPTEEEWILAARGSEGLVLSEVEGTRYPWGPDWDETRANTAESNLGGTTPVGMYPGGRSPAGVWDMAGNVWEWTGTPVQEGVYALRGGSWYASRNLARVGSRGRLNDGYSGDGVGVRVVVSSPSSGFG